MKEQEGENQQSIIERMREIDPKRNFIFVALDELKSSEEIKQFMTEYREWLVANVNNEEVKRDPEGIALREVSYALGLIGPETTERWSEALGSLSHSYFGRNTPDSGTAYQIGGLAGRALIRRN